MRFFRKLLLRTFLTLLLFSLTIFLLTRTDNGKVVFYRTMREIFHIETEVVPLYWGEWVHEKYHIPVKYAYGYPSKDFDGRFERTFQLKNAFPSIELRQYAGRFEKWLHATFFRNRDAAMCYEHGVRLLKDKFHPVDIDTCKDLLDDINAQKSCAVHVRRGDYSHGALGTHPTQAEFFILAVRKIHSLDPNAKFFFFSEEPDWIREKILSALDKDIACRVCDQNDSSKGYLDLYLISRCDHVICSLGGFGHAGRLFSYKKGYYLRGIASDEWHFDWSLKTYDGENIGEEIEKGSVDVREGSGSEKAGS